MIEDNDMDMPQPETKRYGNVSEEYALQKTRELLDLIDFKKLCGPGKRDISDIQNQTEQKAMFDIDLYNFMVEHDDVFEDCVFNWMSEEEFADYLRQRYADEMQYNEYEVIHREVKFK